MKWRPAVEHALLGLLGYGSVSSLLSHDPVKSSLAALLGGLLHGGLQALRHSSLDWRRAAETFEWYRRRQPKAYVTVRIGGTFQEVSEKRPAAGPFLEVPRVRKQELYEMLKGFRLDWETVPFQFSRALSAGSVVILPEELRPYLKGLG